MSSPSPYQPALTVPTDWFDLFWKVMASLLTVVGLLLILRVYRYYRKSKSTALAPTDPTMVLSNQQANARWGSTPGVIVAGIQADNVYRTADGQGEFGSTPPTNVLPELQEATRLSTPIVIAARAEESGGEDKADEVVVAIPYTPEKTQEEESMV